MTPRQKELISQAYRDAGYAVMAVKRGFLVDGVLHSPRKKRCDTSWDTNRRYTVEDVLMLDYAGPIAQYLYMKRTDRGLLIRVQKQQFIKSAASRLENEPLMVKKDHVKRVKKEIEQKVIAELSEPQTWAVVKAVAEAAIKEQELKEKDVLRIWNDVKKQRKSKKTRPAEIAAE